jgi:transcriptional regulator with XRE-family HTH domain
VVKVEAPSAPAPDPDLLPHLYIGNAVRLCREQNGMTQEEFARESGLGWTAATVAKVESGQRKLPAAELFALVHGLGLDVATIDTVRVWQAMTAGRAESQKAFDAERRAATALGITVANLATASEALWGRGFTHERNQRLAERRRAGDDVGTGAAGQISRAMTEELRAPKKGRRK